MNVESGRWKMENVGLAVDIAAFGLIRAIYPCEDAKMKH